MIEGRMNLLAIIIIALALAAAGAVIYAAWELSSDKPSRKKTGTEQVDRRDEVSPDRENGQ
jgi:flagellar basal body-associated protein FliL